MKFAVAVLVAGLFVAVSAEEAGKKKWALLIAGSSGWENYGDQADVCHSYHTVIRHGIPKENIILMIYNDVASDSQNPNPGTLINRLNGSDVYKGVPIDYQGDDITPANFLKILAGDKKAMQGIGTGRVVQSKKDDDVFVYFNDHGGEGILAFPNDMLAVADLTATFKSMHKKHSYGKLVFYVDACNSGSMFDGQLTKELNIYGETSANPDESAYFCQYDDILQTFVNSEYSYNWKVDADNAKVNKETVHQEYDIVTKETALSHVMQYGTIELSKLKLSEFFGTKEAQPIHYPPRKPCNSTWPPSVKGKPSKNDAALILLQFQLAKEKDPARQEYLRNKIEVVKANRQFVDAVAKGVVSSLTRNEVEAKQVLEGKHTKPLNTVCHSAVLRAFHDNCFNMGKNPYALKYARPLANVCELYGENNYFSVVQGIRKACKQLIGTGAV